MSRIPLINIEVDNLTMEEAVQKADELIVSGKHCYAVTPNSDIVVMFDRNKDYLAACQRADLILVDGAPLVWISKWNRRPVKERVAGSDLFPEICKLAAKKGYSVFLLGAAEGVASRAADNLCSQLPDLRIAGCYSPPFGFEKEPTAIAEVIQIVQDAKPDILFLGLGSPKQEFFMSEYLSDLKVPLSFGIGAGIDFIAGSAKRAPKWMRKVGLEWFFRLLQEPRRLFKRYFGDLKVFHLAWKHRNFGKT